ncbi:hypothetical protein [Vibrio stylophorae]|nr:hypothetical protein [Vibrio stylophorae]
MSGFKPMAAKFLLAGLAVLPMSSQAQAPISTKTQSTMEAKAQVMRFNQAPPSGLLSLQWPSQNLNQELNQEHSNRFKVDDGHGWQAHCVRLPDQSLLLETKGSLGVGWEWRGKGAMRIDCQAAAQDAIHGLQWTKGISASKVAAQLALAQPLSAERVEMIWEWQQKGGGSVNPDIDDAIVSDHQVIADLQFEQQKLISFSIYHTATF